MASPGGSGLRRVARRRQTVIPAKACPRGNGERESTETGPLRLRGSPKMDSRHTSLLDRDSWGKSMKHKAPVFTLALLGALALAALSGGLLSLRIAWSYAATKAWVSDSGLPTHGVCLRTRLRASTSATPSRPPTLTRPATLEYGDTLTYSLEGDGRGVVRHRPFDRTAHHEGSAGHFETVQ